MPEPKVTLILFSYQQEQFIASAVRSVLAQEGAAIEIILSDDCSPDATYQIMEKEAAGYRGPHTVRLNRNPENLGFVAHINRAIDLAQGDFIVIAHGDDVSLPHRTRTLVTAWREHGASMVTSNATMVDQDLNAGGYLMDLEGSREIGFDLLIESSSRPCLVGSTLSYERAVFSRFGPIDVEMLPFGPDDQLLPLRAGFLKGVWFVDEPLILYRGHDRNMRHSFINKLQGPLAAEESAHTSLLSVKVCMLEEITRLAQRGEADQIQLDRRRQLQVAILRHLPKWVRARNKLLLRGGRQIWAQRGQFDAMSIRTQPSRQPPGSQGICSA